jgi:hypothetical protein
MKETDSLEAFRHRLQQDTKMHLKEQERGNGLDLPGSG